MQRAIGIGQPDQRRGFGGGLGQVFAPRPGPVPPDEAGTVAELVGGQPPAPVPTESEPLSEPQ